MGTWTPFSQWKGCNMLQPWGKSSILNHNPKHHIVAICWYCENMWCYHIYNVIRLQYIIIIIIYVLYIHVYTFTYFPWYHIVLVGLIMFYVPIKRPPCRTDVVRPSPRWLWMDRTTTGRCRWMVWTLILITGARWNPAMNFGNVEVVILE